MAVTTYSFMSAPDVSSDVAFRKWVQGIHDSFIAAGWVQAADTGQLVISTAVVPSTVSTAAGKLIYRLNDAAQATAPIFVMVEPGKGGSATTAAVWLTVGQSTNGAGVMGNILLARGVSSSSSGATAEFPSYASGDGSSLCLAMWSGTPSACTFQIIVERSRDSAGAPTTDGFLIVFGCQSSQSVSVIGNGGVPGSVKSVTSPFLPVMLPYSVNGQLASVASTLSKDGVTAPVIPVPCAAPGVPPWVSNVIVVVHPGDAGATSVIQAATINGQVRTYRAFPARDDTSGVVAFPPSARGNTLTAGCRPAIIWAV